MKLLFFAICLWMGITKVFSQGSIIPTYKELYRPQFHYSPAQNWMNDPNGLFFYQGLYHNYFQYNPEGNVWGHMSWGHAVSSDLLHWKNLPLAIPEGKDGMIFSGCAVVDSFNRSGLGIKKGIPPVIAIYTRFVPDKQDQCLAFSNDLGNTWTKYEGNPIIDLNKKDFRDPKVFWYAPDQCWIMAVVLPQEWKVLFYRSKNLLIWARIGEYSNPKTGGIWECPDLYPLRVENENPKSKEIRWVLQLSIGQKDEALNRGTRMVYFVGNFNGNTFINDYEALEPFSLDDGKDMYAGSTFNGIPSRDGRRILMSWMSNWDYGTKVPTEPWRCAQTIPRELSLEKIGGRVQLVQKPIRELKKIEKLLFSTSQISVSDANSLIQKEKIKGKNLDIKIKLSRGSQGIFTLNLRKGLREFTQLKYNADSQNLSLDRSQSGQVSFHPHFSSIETAQLNPKSSFHDFQILLDDSSVEVFADQGQKVITDVIFPNSDSRGLSMKSTNTSMKLEKIEIYEVKSIW